MKGWTSRKYEGIPLGLMIQGSIAKTTTWRIRKGTGTHGTKKGEIIQDKYPYYVPSSINNPESEPRRRQLKAAVSKWKYGLTPAEKKAYNDRVRLAMHMSGNNLFIREAMGGLVDMFVDRGDPTGYDFTQANFTKDGTWRNKDISSIIPVSAKAVLIELGLQTTAAGKKVAFKQYGNTNNFNSANAVTAIAGTHQNASAIVAVDHNQRIAYNIDAATWTNLDFVIKGWWT